MMNEDVCEYCRDTSDPKPLRSSFSKMYIYDDGEIDIEDDQGFVSVFFVNYCPMCGARLVDNEQ